MTIPLPILDYLQKGKMSVVSTTTSLDTYCALLIMIGTTNSKYNSCCKVCTDNLLRISVRAKLRESEEGYDYTSNFFLHCLYEGEEGDPEFPDISFLKGPLLICVSAFTSIYLLD